MIIYLFKGKWGGEGIQLKIITKQPGKGILKGSFYFVYIFWQGPDLPIVEREKNRKFYQIKKIIVYGDN